MGDENKKSEPGGKGITQRLKRLVADPARRVTLIVLALAVIVFIWYVLADRHTPYTTQARIDALTVPIVPRVSGYVTEVNVRLHSVVEEDETLLQIDKRPFEIGSGRVG